jgi:hypothetical protein
MKIILPTITALVACCILQGCAVAQPAAPDISLRKTVERSAIFDLKDGDIPIVGQLRSTTPTIVRIRVTTSLGKTALAQIPAKDGAFACRYPSNFPGAKLDSPCMLFIDATTAPDFNTATPGHEQAEAAALICDSRRKLIPDLPNWFTDDLRDRDGRVDSSAAQWPIARTLINLYMKSQAARVVGIGRQDFDLAKPDDLTFFKHSLGLYEFDYRDRDWSTPLNHRVARTFWQSVWATWFNSSNDNPIDGDKNNQAQSNYRPYVFSNDYSDTLISYLMRMRGVLPTKDNLTVMCREGTQNLLAMQHTDNTNFALIDQRGKQERYTAGAFKYGMFDNGEFMTEGNGWFYNPAFLDYVAGGVLNGRCVWAMGEALKADPNGPLAPKLKNAIALSIKFCLSDSLAYGYARKTANGNAFWRDAGEHAYLTIGMLAACSVAPNIIVLRPEGKQPITLRQACVSALNALVDLEHPDHQWAIYPNVDSMAIVALADGAILLHDSPSAPAWRKTASEVADAWMNAKVDPKEFPGKVVHFGIRITPDTMTYNWSRLSPSWGSRNYIFFYQSGHWIQALSRLYALTGEPRYRRRAEAMVSYFCGDNPWGLRLINEIGGVYNWVEDRDGDGVEDNLKQDMYPESTDFCQIGIMHLMRAIIDHKSCFQNS